MINSSDETHKSENVNIKAESVNVSKLMHNGNFDNAGVFKVENYHQNTVLRTPDQLFWAAASVTAGVIFSAGIIFTAWNALKYLVELF